MAFYQAMPWHEGEDNIRRAMQTPERDNPTVPSLSSQLANHLQIAPLISIGTLDSDGRPWTTLWGGERPLAMPLGGGIVGVRTTVSSQFDPVVETLVGNEATGQVVRESGKGRMVSGLTIDLVTRKRVKFAGRMVAGALECREDDVLKKSEQIAEIQLVCKIEQSLGNCPKYLNSWKFEPASSQPELVSETVHLPEGAVDLVAKADLFFVSSSQKDVDMDTNHRGGPPGFLRIASNNASGAVFFWPEYSGNRLYQTLGNLSVNPKAGLCVPDFVSGNVLYLTGTTRILIGKDAAAMLPKSNLCVELTVTAARFVTQALPFRGVLGEASPYNPAVRYLTSERPPVHAQDQQLQQATLLSQTRLTPTISRFKFSLQNAASYKPGQYVTFDLSSHLDIGYSHMRDDDPRSLNDDFVRTFTVSSSPGNPPDPVHRLKDDDFEITIRKVGVATEFIFKHDGGTNRQKLEVGVKGFGGEFEVSQDSTETVCFVAAGVGITPLLPFLWSLDYARLKLLWTIREGDIGLVLDILHANPQLGASLTIFITNATNNTASSQELKATGADLQTRRMEETDLEFGDQVSKYYLCTSVPMREILMQWLPDKNLVFEDFNF